MPVAVAAVRVFCSAQGCTREMSEDRLCALARGWRFFCIDFCCASHAVKCLHLRKPRECCARVFFCVCSMWIFFSSFLWSRASLGVCHSLGAWLWMWIISGGGGVGCVGRAKMGYAQVMRASGRVFNWMHNILCERERERCLLWRMPST